MSVLSKPELMAVADVSKMIEEGRTLSLAAEEALLRQLPQGNWIGGTIPYFMAANGGAISQDKIFVSELPADVQSTQIKTYDVEQIPHVLDDAPEQGFSIIILPATSNVHLQYACGAPTFNDMFLKPIAGWVSGVHLDDLGTITPKVFDGSQSLATDQLAVVMHATLPEHLIANIGIVNLFTQGEGDVLVFDETGFAASEATINGQRQNLHDYLKGIDADTRWPLVANYNGAMMNVAFQSVEPDNVSFYGPVFAGVEYRQAMPVSDYVKEFEAATPQLGQEGLAFSCNCVLNFLYSELEGKQTSMFGPMTFGEIAYQLLTQTLVYMDIHEA